MWYGIKMVVQGETQDSWRMFEFSFESVPSGKWLELSNVLSSWCTLPDCPVAFKTLLSAEERPNRKPADASWAQSASG